MAYNFRRKNLRIRSSCRLPKYWPFMHDVDDRQICTECDISRLRIVLSP